MCGASAQLNGDRTGGYLCGRRAVSGDQVKLFNELATVLTGDGTALRWLDSTLSSESFSLFGVSQLAGGFNPEEDASRAKCGGARSRSDPKHSDHDEAIR